MIQIINAPLDKNLVVVWHPWTWKTVAAVHRFVRLYKEGKKVLFLCYNNLLRQWILKVLLNEFKLSEYIKNNVRTLDSFFGKIQRKYYSDEREPKYVNKMSLEEINNLIDYYKTIEQYDAIIIDEWQDFSLEILENLEKLTNHISIFMDKLQIINVFLWHTSIDYEFLEEQKDYRLLFLYKNYRTPRNIYETAFSWFVSENEDLMYTESIISTEWKLDRVKDINIKEIVDDIVKFWETNKWSLWVFLNKIVNVENLYSIMSERLGKSNVRMYTSRDKEEDIDFHNKIIITTFKSAKWLEFDNVIVLITPEDRGLENINKQLFVLSTRTRNNIKFYFLNDNQL